jgi:hypothetical protein
VIAHLYLTHHILAVPTFRDPDFLMSRRCPDNHKSIVTPTGFLLFRSLLYFFFLTLGTEIKEYTHVMIYAPSGREKLSVA